VLVLRAQAENFTLLLPFEALDGLNGGLLVGLHVIVPGISELLELVPLNGFDLQELIPLLRFHAAHLTVQLVRGKLLQLVLGASSLNVVHLLLGLLEVVLEKLQELHGGAFGCAADTSLRSEFAKLFPVSLVLQHEESIELGCGERHLSCNICVFLRHFAVRVFSPTLSLAFVDCL